MFWWSNDPDAQHIFIDVQEARSLKSFDISGWADPYVKIKPGPDIAIGETRTLDPGGRSGFGSVVRWIGTTTPSSASM
jgi:hypothetical protein